MLFDKRGGLLETENWFSRGMYIRPLCDELGHTLCWRVRQIPHTVTVTHTAFCRRFSALFSTHTNSLSQFIPSLYFSHLHTFSAYSSTTPTTHTGFRKPRVPNPNQTRSVLCPCNVLCNLLPSIHYLSVKGFHSLQCIY